MRKNWVWCVNLFFILYLTGAFLAPYLGSIEHHNTERALRHFYHLNCHQIPDRCFTVAHSPMALCSRCTGIYTGMLAAGIAYAVCRFSGIGKGVFLMLISPTLIDWASEFFHLYSGDLYIRFVIGILFGTAIVLFVYPPIDRFLLKGKEG